jgi:hypothetical protein
MFNELAEKYAETTTRERAGDRRILAPLAPRAPLAPLAPLAPFAPFAPFAPLAPLALFAPLAPRGRESTLSGRSILADYWSALRRTQRT